MALALPDDLMVSVSGFRGRVGESMTPELVAGVAARFGSLLRSDGEPATVLVGRDSRTSGPMLSRAVVAGLQSVGCWAVDLGVVPTPTVLLAVEEGGVAGGIVVSASHNPAEWNALKFASAEGMFLDAEEMDRFRELLDGPDPDRAAWDAILAAGEDAGAVDRHLERILDLPFLDREGLRERSFRVALDCVHGAGGVILPRLLSSLGCEVEAIGTEADGHFPREPEPIAENLGDLVELVRRTGADIGFAVDPDVDRLALVDETGTPLGEDLTLALAADVVLRRDPGPVVTNLSTSRVVEDVARSHDVPFHRAPVGEIHVARRMEAEDAVIGGEGNGGVILPAIHRTRDAPVAAALLLQHLLDGDEPLSRLAARWPSYRIVKEKISFPREAIEDAYRVLEEDLGAPGRDTSDGLRLEWPERRTWLHVRPSGTEPVVRLIAEAEEESTARELIDRARDRLEGVA